MDMRFSILGKQSVDDAGHSIGSNVGILRTIVYPHYTECKSPSIETKSQPERGYREYH